MACVQADLVSESQLGEVEALLLKSLMQFVIYIILFGIVAYFFQHQIEALTGINPISATLNLLADFGLPVDSKDSVLVTDPN